MVNWKNVSGITLMAIAVQASALNTDIKGFFSTAPGPEKNLPADEVYPRGRLFPFSFYYHRWWYREKTWRPFA